MKFFNWMFAALFVASATFASAQCGLFISEYGEGSSSNKWIELYNPTLEALDLSQFQVQTYANGNTSPNYTLVLEGTLAAGEVYTITNSSAVAEVAAVSNVTSTITYFNGDDAVALLDLDGNIIDAFGEIGVDPGSSWDVAGVAGATANHTLVRIASVTQGNADWAASFASEWEVYDSNDFSFLGGHTFTGVCGTAVEGCTNENATNYNAEANTDDGSCTFDNACNIDGTVVQATGTLTFEPADLSVAIGTTVVFENIGGTHNANGDINTLTGESFGNPVAFTFDAVTSTGEGVCIGSFTFDVPGVYNYDCSVGSHAASGMVGTITVGTGGCNNPAAPNYNDAADYDDGSCLAVVETSIADIQEGQLTEAYTGQTLVTTGIVTGVFGSLASVQDGTGAYSGIWMFGSNVNLTVGDEVEITATVSEYYGLTQLSSPSVVILSQGNELPAAEALGTAAVADEQWEGVLVTVTGEVVDPALGFGEWSLSDGSGDARVDDRGYDALLTGAVVAGSTWEVTGPLEYSFSNFKIQPRSADDALLYGCTNAQATNYNPAAGIPDGSCIFDNLDCGVFFSEYGEGGGNNKYLEIFNATGNTVFLSQYTLGNCNNGCDQPDAAYVSDQVDYWTFNFPSDATIPSGGHYIVAHPSADAVILELADMTYQYLSNGDDTYVLAELTETDTLIVDQIGTIEGGDPGSGWEVAGVTNGTANHTLVRKSSISNGNMGDFAASAGTNEFDSEWIVLDQDDFSNLGQHAIDAICATTFDGCTDEFALNYDPAATNDDGSCVYIPNLTVQEIHQTNATGQVITSGIVTGVYPPLGDVAGNASYVIQNGTGAQSGVWVIGEGVAIGDEVEVTGVVADVYGLVQIQGAVAEVMSSGNALPAAELLSTDAVSDQQWESVLVRVEAPVTDAVGSYGEWQLNDGSGMIRAKDHAFSAIDAVVNVDGTDYPLLEEGTNYRVTGPNFYSYGSYKMMIRDANDVLRLGCTDTSFLNYDALAQEDDGSCSSVTGCMNPDADNYDPAAVADDGSCLVSGCGDVNALNFDEAVNNPTNEDCYYTLPNLIINEISYNPCSAQGDDFDYEFVEIFNAEDMAVSLAGFAFYNTSGGNAELAYEFGDDDMLAAGEYALLTVSANGTANYAYTGAQIFEMFTGNFSNSGEAVSLQDSYGNIIDEVVYDDAGSWPSTTVSVLGNTLVQSPDGDCSTLELIATDLNNDDPDNWQGSWVDFGTPGAANSSAFGCADPTACNFSATAYFDDGSCDYACQGCTYADAANFDMNATMDDGTCTFDLVDPCPADLNDDGFVSAVDLLQFLAQFGLDCPE